VFRAYVDVLAKAEAAAQQKALAAFQELLVAAQVAADTAWPEFAAAHAQDRRFAALPTEAERRAAFEGFTGQLRAAREAAQRKEAAAAEAAARAAARAAQRLAEAQAAKERAAARAALKAAAAEAAEASFRQLLQEREAAIAAGLDYPQAKRMLWTDPRCVGPPPARSACPLAAPQPPPGSLLPAHHERPSPPPPACPALPTASPSPTPHPTPPHPVPPLAPPLPPPHSFDAVPEYRRKALYADYVAILDEAGLLAPEEQRAAAAAAAAASAGELAELAEAEEGASQEQLEFLRREQARLKEEYAK
jgi:hypothetical protein